MYIKDILSAQEGRRLEFKAELPTNSDLAKTVCAFANDAGGEIYLGINDVHTVVGLPEDELPQIEEQISNLIYDRCYPAILPEISFLTIEDKHIIRIVVYKGSQPPYYLKQEGKLHGTYVRVGSTNRLADNELIAELERKRRNISFDSEVVMEKEAAEVDITSFKQLFKEKTDEELTPSVLRKLELVRTEQGKEYPTNALILLSDDKLRHAMFPNAKIECARFKGTGTEEFIDQKSITVPLGQQAEEAYNFVLRHINKSATVEGIYTVSRWQYPVKAIREIIRNAVVHRQYSLTGKDIKVAIYDDMVEVTSPGLLPPSIDYAAMESRQSDARNKVIAPVFKHLGVIDQWGNGLKLVAEEMRKYPHIELRWKEVGMSFQIQFAVKDYEKLMAEEDGQRTVQVGSTAPLSKKEDNSQETSNIDKYPKSITPQAPPQAAPQVDRTSTGQAFDENVGIDYTANMLITLIKKNNKLTTQEIAKQLNISKRTCERIIAKLKQLGKIQRLGNTSASYWVIAD